MAVERRTDGFHMLSLAAKDALCCWHGNYVMVGNGAKDGCWRSSRPGRSDVPEDPSSGSRTCSLTSPSEQSHCARDCTYSGW